MRKKIIVELNHNKHDSLITVQKTPKNFIEKIFMGESTKQYYGSNKTWYLVTGSGFKKCGPVIENWLSSVEKYKKYRKNRK